MSSEVDNLIANAKSISEEARETFGGLSKEQLNTKPSSVEWSIAQCFDHLNTVSEMYLPQIEKVADGTHVNNWFSAIPLISGKVGSLLKSAVSPDAKTKRKAPPFFVPSQSEITETIIGDFCDVQEQLISFMNAVRDQDIRKIKIPTPISPMINIRLDDAFEILILHERRHFNQAKRVLEVVENLR
ncbi:MAG: DinB family protein [Pyrinomonadaceae bacterium]